MLNPDVEAALNAQLNQEQGASHGYLSAAAYFEDRNLAGFAAFMRRQADEERVHAMKFYDHVCERGGRVVLGAIPAPDADFDSPLAAFKAVWEWEKANTRSIHELYDLASKRNDHATRSMLHWFIDEQVEEEQWCEEAVGLLELAGTDGAALLMLDARYGEKAAMPAEDAAAG